MAQSSTPSFPSRYRASSGLYSAGFADDSPVRPPVLTAQGREDVERLRAKVRAHNPGYVYTNGVSLPSQLPSVPELLDELARNVAGAKGRGEVPATPLPEVEPSELAKAGFDWRAIADRAITALETGSRRPLPLANDPEAAKIPGLSVIAASGTFPMENPVSGEIPSEESATSDKPVATDIPDYASSQDVPLPEDTFEPENSDSKRNQDVPNSEPVRFAAVEEENTQEATPEELPEVLPLDEDLVSPRVYDDEVLEPEGNDDELFVGDIEGQPATWESVSEDTEHSPESSLQMPLDEESQIIPEEVAADVAPHETTTTDENADSEETLEDMPEALPVDDDLVSSRAYDDEVLEPEGNDDELFVGDVEGQPASWTANTEEAESGEPAELPDSPDAVFAPEEDEEATVETPELGSELAEAVEAEAAIQEPEASSEKDETEENSPQGEDSSQEESAESAEESDATAEEPSELDEQTELLSAEDSEDTLFEEPLPAELSLPESGSEENDIQELSAAEPEPPATDELPEDILEETSEGVGEVENIADTDAENDSAEISDFDLADLDLDALDETPLPEAAPAETADSPLLEEAGEMADDANITAEHSLEEADKTEPEEHEENQFAEMNEPQGELPGGSAIGTEVSLPEEEMEDEENIVDMGEFALSEEYNQSEEDTADVSDGYVEDDSEESLEFPAESDITSDTIEYADSEQAAEDTLFEDFQEEDSGEESFDSSTGENYEEEIEAETDFFESDGEEYSEEIEEQYEQPAKKGFFRRLFGR